VENFLTTKYKAFKKDPATLSCSY